MKILKGLISFTVIMAMLTMSICAVSADRSFSDLASGHWAYSYIQTLVNDGTINGYEDGTFLPEAKVTRAEFVKMIGKTSVSYPAPFNDVPESHWGYDYIMYSDMDVDGNSFFPDEYITRNDVIKLLWKRAGSDKSVAAAGLIENQSDNKYAAAWGYTYGIMTGNDGINLRLNDGLTRAEAAALICRSRAISADSEKFTFADQVNKDLLKKYYNAFELFEGEYSPSKTFTNGELAEAAMRIASDSSFVTYNNIPTDISVDREHTLAFYTVCKNVFGTDNMTEAFYDAKANNLNMVAALTFAYNYKASKHIVGGELNNYYTDITDIGNDTINKFVTAAYKNGIRLDNSNNLNPNAEANAEAFALLLLQFDNISGLNTNYVVKTNTSYGYDTSISSDITAYPDSHDKYKFVLKEVPTYVYAKSMLDENLNEVTAAPKDTFRMARDRNSIFTSFLSSIVNVAKSEGTEAKITYYPSMVAMGGKGYVMRVKIEIISANGKKFGDVFAAKSNLDDFALQDGMVIYADIASASLTVGLNLPITNAVFTQIIQ